MTMQQFREDLDQVARSTTIPVDPASAWQRGRRRRVRRNVLSAGGGLTVVLAVIVLLPMMLGGSHTTPPTSSPTVRADVVLEFKHVEGWAPTGGGMRLACPAVRGSADGADMTKACDLLNSMPSTFFERSSTANDEKCRKATFGPESARMVGSIDGHKIDARFHRLDTCSESRWQQIKPLIQAVTSPPLEPSFRADALEGEWEITALVGDDGRSILHEPQSTPLRVKIDATEFRGNTECNVFTIPYARAGDRGQDLRLLSIKAGSAAEECANETKVLSRLMMVRHVSKVGNDLHLHADNWMILAVLKPVD